ncbi:hypothetical protein HX089_12505 [Myroides odoratimimus]|uniref:hypothetical protein n=1 Tax=Myroides odoratimimus TaxID=76832 RepID=UPI00257818C5|nr:hypothetical protein [Myroides odoratimimus]MDM1517208.1 hypothetical protein [Myroides odoratimimus]MDM1536341.1 hypothetical protein [Myroides odoratimimus]MDM1675913.1 hypothetical protein [Myroides odoratimimus]
MKKEIDFNKNEEPILHKVTYSDREEVIIDNTGKLEGTIALINELKASGEWQRFNEMLERNRAEKKARK